MCGEGRDSGEVYSRLRWWSVKRARKRGDKAYVPVLPERASEEWIMSREVPKSESMALGLKAGEYNNVR